ncbi:hypothetical protein DRQ09_01390 [candidate division KSB1 bacterium]|nr:MAG: hypothetical protein DRQ09_01390 [candidate division KSB1 bacterium]
MIKEIDYDIIIVGGGPAGTTSAYYSALNGAKVILFERHLCIGNPVRCAEGVSRRGLEEFFNPDELQGINRVNKLQIFAPSGAFVTIKTDEVGYIINRKVFDFNLAKRASEKGVKIITRANVIDLINRNGKIEGVKVVHLGKEYDIYGKIIIGADGIESRVGKLSGLRKSFKLDEIDSCVQATIYSKEIDNDICRVYFGHDIAPGGYAWIFPRGDNTANAGLGISGVASKKQAPVDYLRKFLERSFSEYSVLAIIGGGVPCAKVLKELVIDNVILVGDAAHQTNPLTGGGIINAMRAGKIAGEIAATAIKENDCSEKFLRKYETEWKKLYGNRHSALYRLKKSVYSISDDVLNRIAYSMNRLSEEERTLANTFKIALKEKPKLVLDALKIFSGV